MYLDSCPGMKMKVTKIVTRKDADEQKHGKLILFSWEIRLQTISQVFVGK